MDHKSLVKSSKDTVIIGDLGSSSINEVLTNWSVVGTGTEEGILEYAHNCLQGVEIVHEKVEKREGGKMYYEARIKGNNGLPDGLNQQLVVH